MAHIVPAMWAIAIDGFWDDSGDSHRPLFRELETAAFWCTRSRIVVFREFDAVSHLSALSLLVVAKPGQHSGVHVEKWTSSMSS